MRVVWIYRLCFNTLYPSSLDDLSWDNLFWLQAKLLEEQRAYIASCAVGEHDNDNTLLTEAENAVEEAGAAKVAARCQGLRDEFDKAKSANKHADGSQGDGEHGYITRMLEQICGNDGDIFDAHKRALIESRRSLKNAANRLTNSTCSAEYKLTSEEQSLLERINDGNGWSPNEIPNLKDAALCVGYLAVRARNNSSEILDLVTRLMK